jgi:hypothetical protein
MCDYETGFDPNGNFFWRSKTVASSSVLAIDQENAISDINDYHRGYDMVYNAAIITYGPYINTYDGAAAGEAAPTSEQRLGRIVQAEDWGSVLLAYDVNIAQGRARLIYTNNHLPRRRFRYVGDILPFIMLSDALTVTYVDSPLLRDNIAGDPMQAPGQAGTAQNVLALNMKVKVLAVNHKPDTDTGEMILQEVLP